MIKNNRNKFMASAAALALVATAVAPAAGAQVSTNADVSYSDVDPKSSHFPNIYKALDYKIMTGFPNHTFKPNQMVTRGQVVKALGKYVVASSGKPLSEFDLKDVPPFKDVPSTIKDQELYTFSLIVKQAGIFRGDNNNLMAGKLITREQMSQVLVNGFGLEDRPGNLSKITDNGSANSQYRGYIDILSENSVTTESVFRPKESTSRAQFASFLVRAYEIQHNEDRETPSQAVAAFELAMGGFVSVGEEFGFDVAVDPAKDNTFNISVPADAPEDGEESGTGFFQSLADEGIEKITIGGTAYTISDGEGNVASGAQAAKEAIIMAVGMENTVNITVEIPYADGTDVTTETYTFNFVS
ncbi:S-layer homology domain-containing protein [Planococcus beigongshangi]|uniref:S-layer homology domain-containing protein n=1 Tax=Planococcus beigongshangi TaxID=2782536 RepID=UPI00193C4591|nr:S-layer homology domain-containing protein [Planococcus beigongshangi]